MVVPGPILCEGIGIRGGQPTAVENVKTETQMTPEVGVGVE